MNAEKSQELLTLTQHVIDLKMEKKSFNKDINISIKESEARIKELVAGQE